MRAFIGENVEGEEGEKVNGIILLAPTMASQGGGPETVANIKKETTCALCLDLFEEPKTLPACLHTFCKDCILLAEAGRRRLRRVADAAGEDRVEESANRIECPKCRRVSHVEGGPSAIVTSFMYANIVQHLRDGDNFQANEMAPVSVHGARSLLEPSIPDTSPMCPKHPDEKLKLYCFDCEEVICRDCTVKQRDHKNHNFEFVKEVAAGERESLAGVMSPLTEKMDSLARARERMRESRRDLERTGEEREREIISTFDRCWRKLEERKRHFLELSKTTTDMKLLAVKCQEKEIVSLHSQISELVQKTEGDLKTANDVGVFLMRREIITGAKCLSQMYQSVPTGPGERDEAKFAMDLSVLDTMGKITELPCPLTSFVEDLKLVKPVQNEETTLTVVAQNAKGHALIHGGGACSAQISCCSATTGKIHIREASVTDNNDGSYTVGFSPQFPGKTSLEVFFDNELVGESAYDMDVVRNFRNVKLEPFVIGLPDANPWGVALLSDKEIAVTASDAMIHILSTSEGGRGGGRGVVESIRSNFKRPYGLCYDAEGSLWVTDREGHNVQKFQRQPAAGGKFEKVFQFGLRGVNPGLFSHPRGIAIHPSSGCIYISDMKNHRVQIFSPSQPLPVYKSHFGGPGKAPGLFDLPAGLCFDRHSNLLVCDDRNSRIQVFDAEGRYLHSLGIAPSRKGVLCSPISVACDRHGQYVVTEFGSHAITFMSPEGEILSCVRNLGTEYGQFVHPRGVACDSLGYVFVADHDNSRIVRF